MSDTAYFLIESGHALKLFRKHIRMRIATEKRVAAMCREIPGADRVISDLTNGRPKGLTFVRGTVYGDWTKADKKGYCYPKKGTDWAKRFAAENGYQPAEDMISVAFDIPLNMSYSKAGEFTGSCMLGYPLRACGFLWLSKNGPFAMYAPDVPAAVAHRQSQGETVNEPAASFEFKIDGARRILKEEWEMIVAQHNFERALAA